MRIRARVVKGKAPPPEDDELTIEGQSLTSVDFSNRRLGFLNAIASRFERCNFSEMVVAENAAFGAGQQQSIYVECSFDGSHLAAPTPGNARFERCTFRKAIIKGLKAYRLEFIDCVFSGRIVSTIFCGRDIATPEQYRGPGKQNEYQGNDFREADLRDVAFRGGIDLNKQLLPNAPDYLLLQDAPRALNELKNSRSYSGEPELVQSLVAVLTNEIETGQKQVILRESTFAIKPADRPHVHALFEFLRAIARDNNP